MSGQETEPGHPAAGGVATAPMVDVRDVTRTYGSGPTSTAALRGVTFSIGEGEPFYCKNTSLFTLPITLHTSYLLYKACNS